MHSNVYLSALIRIYLNESVSDNFNVYINVYTYISYLIYTRLELMVICLYVSHCEVYTYEWCEHKHYFARSFTVITQTLRVVIECVVVSLQVRV